MSEFNLNNWSHGESAPNAIGVFLLVINLAFFPIEEILNKGFKDLDDPFFYL